VEPLKEKYQLILIDVRGHGASDKPHKPEAYRMKTLAADIVAVLDQLKVRKAHFLGYSLGGHIGFALAKYAPERFHSMIIGGTHPYKPNAEEKAELESIIQRYKKGKDAVIAEAEKRLGKKMTPTYRAQAMAADTEALVALLSSERARSQTSSFEEVLPTMSMPCLIYVGEKDTGYSGARKCAESMPNATFVSLPNLDHRGAGAQSSIILPYIIKFLDKLSRT
jgi:pimeloyl-ACP methyl ester carboxylesterase